MDIIYIYLLFAMVATCYLDVTRYTIPNWLVASVLVLYPIALYLSPYVIDWMEGLKAFGLLFALGFVLFMLKIMGAGDVKLIAVLGLWVGWKHLPDFVILFAIFGGILSIVLLILRRLQMYLPWKQRFKPRILEKGAPVPYGIAIAFGFAWLLLSGKIALFDNYHAFT